MRLAGGFVPQHLQYRLQNKTAIKCSQAQGGQTREHGAPQGKQGTTHFPSREGQAHAGVQVGAACLVDILQLAVDGPEGQLDRWQAPPCGAWSCARGEEQRKPALTVANQPCSSALHPSTGPGRPASGRRSLALAERGKRVLPAALLSGHMGGLTGMLRGPPEANSGCAAKVEDGPHAGGLRQQAQARHAQPAALIQGGGGA